jgi:hypothetical protein
MRGIVDITIKVGRCRVTLMDVPYYRNEGYDPGCRTLTNGDPGYPPSDSYLVTVEWSAKEAVDAVVESLQDDGRHVPLGIERRAWRILDAIQEEVGAQVCGG